VWRLPASRSSSSSCSSSSRTMAQPQHSRVLVAA
jgi:hypothetical protein